MTIEHTAGKVLHDTRGYPHPDVRAESGRKIACTWGTGPQAKSPEAYKKRTAEDRANARRIVACWNACQGITTESLEENGEAGYEHTVALTKQLAEVRMVLLSVKLEWAQLWAAMDALPDDWIQTTRDMYFQMLECVPPRAQVGGIFLVGEAKTHNAEGKAVHACFKEVCNKYFAKHMTVEQFKAL